ncbi:MAG: hypothetical protein U0Q12_25935 [Vicinamibacterales bacterium]
MEVTRIGFTIGFSLAILATAGRPSHAQSQTSAPSVTAGLGLVSLWDDETFLGRGPVISGGVSLPIGRPGSLEGEVAVAPHRRDAGYLAADGTLITATARGVLVFGAPSRRTRAFVSGGLSAIHSRGTLTTASFQAGPGGLPVPGPSERQPWALTSLGYEIGGGAQIGGSRRLVWRPEARWTFGAGRASSRSIEPPLWAVRAGITLLVRTRR